LTRIFNLEFGASAPHLWLDLADFGVLSETGPVDGV
jgi:hypothetical protein